jgi:AraC family transcriptional regulator of adaptative response / DNA-3-methyladenine glycosylase II
LGYSVRQVERHLVAEVGAGPIALARAQRAQTARVLIETTTLPFAEVAFAAGFASIRQFNDTVRAVFALPPTDLRRQRRRSESAAPDVGAAPGTLVLRLPLRAPFCPDNLFGHLAATTVPGCEEATADGYRRTLRLPHGPGIVGVRPRPDYVECVLSLTKLRDLPAAIARTRRLLDLDADPQAVDELLVGDPALAPLVRKAPGRRVPRSTDSCEFAVRAVLGQQVSTAAARTHAARLVASYGDPIQDHDGGLTHLFPSNDQLAAIDVTMIAVPTARRRTLADLLGRLAAHDIELDAGSDWQHARTGLAAIEGVGPWTIEMIAMRALGDPDAFPLTDMGVRRAARALGIATNDRELAARSERWRPWRAYATQYLWATLDHPINAWPASLRQKVGAR